MMYDKQAIKQFIMDYHKEKSSNVVSYDDTDIDDFFLVMKSNPLN